MTEPKPIRPLHEYPSSDSFDRKDVKLVIRAVHVIPQSSTTWTVKKGGDHAVSRTFRSRHAAVEFGKAVSSSTSSTLYIHDRSGKVEEFKR
jgi:hypothetical protein